MGIALIVISLPLLIFAIDQVGRKKHYSLGLFYLRFQFICRARHWLISFRFHYHDDGLA